MLHNKVYRYSFNKPGFVFIYAFILQKNYFGRQKLRTFTIYISFIYLYIRIIENGATRRGTGRVLLAYYNISGIW